MEEKKIYENIKKKAEDVSVPKSLQPENIEKILKGKKQKKQTRFIKYGSLIAAACLVIVAGVSINVQMFNSIKENILPEDPVVEKYVEDEKLTYDTVYSQIKKYHAQNYTSDATLENGAVAFAPNEDVAESFSESKSSSKSSAAAESESSSGKDYSDTDLQVKNVMEGDIVKTDGNHIFMMREASFGTQIEIYKADENAKDAISTITINDATCSEMYLEKDKLFAIETKNDHGNQSTVVHSYNISNIEKPEHIKDLAQSGAYATSRVSGGYMYIFSNYFVYNIGKKKEYETYIPKCDGSLFGANDICRIDEEKTNAYMIMTSFKIDNPSKMVDKKAVLGFGNTYYVSEKNIYVAKSNHASTGKTTLVKYAYDRGMYHKKAMRDINGRLENSYYMNEYNGNFFYVYTHYKNGKNVNGIVSMDENLQPLSDITNLGVNENIYASYYIDDKAYFVTYRNTDPVFAVDLSNPKKLKLLSELKLPGFSSYLHKFGDNQLIGIGKDEVSRVKISLFDISKNGSVKEVFSKSLTKIESESIANSNHKAVYIDEKNKLIGFGIESMTDYSSPDNGRDYRLYKVDGSKITTLVKQKIDSGIEAVRGLHVGNYFYVADVDRGITVYDRANYKKIN